MGYARFEKMNTQSDQRPTSEKIRIERRYEH